MRIILANLRLQPWLSRASSCLVGGYFLSAAILKLLAAKSVTAGAVTFPPALQFLAVQIEICLGAWLILGRMRVAAWLAALLVLLVFAGISLTSVLRGQSDCGCFGDVNVHPGWTAALNLAALSLVVAFRPRVTWSERRGTVLAVAGVAVIVAALALVANAPLGDKLLARLEGRVLVLRPSVVDAGSGPEGEVKRLRATVVNKSSHDIRLVGGSVSCLCTTTPNLPLTVPADGEAEIQLELKYRGTPGRFEHHFELFTDERTQPKLRGNIVGRVAE